MIMSADEIGAKIFCAVLLGGGFLFFTFINYSIIYRARIKHENTPSLTPFLGGTSGALFMLLMIGAKKPLLILLPLLIDPGSIPIVIEFIVLIIKEKIEKKP